MHAGLLLTDRYDCARLVSKVVLYFVKDQVRLSYFTIPLLNPYISTF